MLNGSGISPFGTSPARSSNKVREDDITGLGAEIAYSAIFAIPAFLLFLVMLAAVVNQFTGIPVAESLQTIIAERAPADLRPLLDELVP